MHAFKNTRPFALMLPIICLAIAAPTSDIHADSCSDAVVHAEVNVPDSAVIRDRIATYLAAATSTTDKTGGSTLKPDPPADCNTTFEYCTSNSDCCGEQCLQIFVSASL